MPVTFLGGSLIRVCTGSFGNVFGGVNLENNKVGQIFFGSEKEVMSPSWCLQLFSVDHYLGHAQEALGICQKAQTSKILK